MKKVSRIQKIESLADGNTSMLSILNLGRILEYVRYARGFNTVGYCIPVLESRIANRLQVLGAASYNEYMEILRTSSTELDALVDILTIHVSSFFRDPLTFEYLYEYTLPTLLAAKAASHDPSIRIWSAGCASGEEPYSIAILLHELIKYYNSICNITILATDIDNLALDQAREAHYTDESLGNIHYNLFKTYFTRNDDGYTLHPSIKDMVSFSVHDIIDRRTISPAESIFGSFDIILCRNVLIYFTSEFQEIIHCKLNQSLSDNGYLILGRTESLPETWRRCYRRITECSSIYQKITDHNNHPKGSSHEI